MPKVDLSMGLSQHERSLLKRVALISLAISIAIVALFWFVQTRSLDDSARSSGIKKSPRPPMAGAEALSTLDIEAHQVAATHFLRADQPGRAIPHLQRVLSVNPSLRAARTELATTFLKSGSYKEAEREFRDLLGTSREDTLSPLIASRYGLALFYTGETSRSIEQLTSCITKYPSCPEAACYLGQVMASVQMPSAEAEKHFQAALSLSPSYVEARYQQARYFMNNREYLRSRDSMLRILEIEPLHAKTHSRLGMAYYYLNQYELARKYYLTALALNPLDYNTRYNLGELLLLSEGQEARALEEFREVIAAYPDHIEANFKIGVICSMNRMYKEAIVHLERATTLAPQSVRMLLQLAAAYERVGLNDKALVTYQAILRLDALNRIALQKVKLLETTRNAWVEK